MSHDATATTSPGGKAVEVRPGRLVTASWVLPIATPPIADGGVVVGSDGTVLDVGTRAEVRGRHGPLIEEHVDGVLLPGLVDAHTHLALGLTDLVPGGRGLVAWAGDVVAAAGKLTADDRREAATRAALDASERGTAAVGEVANSLDAVSALGHAGLRGVVFHELLGSRDVRTGDALADAAAEHEHVRAQAGWPERVAYVPAPHAPYSVSPALFRRIFQAASTACLPTSVHLAEDPDELALLHDGTGAWPDVLARLGVPAGERTPHMTPVAYMESLGAFAGPRPPLLVHMVHAGADDLSRAQHHGATVVLCPRSNQHIGGRLPDVRAMRAHGLSLALGTDSRASSPDHALWGEMAALATAFPDLPPSIWLRAATLGGADALALPALGALAAGRRPGVLAVSGGDLDGAHSALDLQLRLVRINTPTLRWVARA